MSESQTRDPTGKHRPGTTGAGNLPDPGGDIDTVDVTPQSHEDGRTSGPDTNESTKERTESVERQLSGGEQS